MQSKRSVILFLLILIFSYLYFGFNDTLSKRPQSVHQWAQCDRTSVALNFGTETFNIFKPRVHNIGNGTGITGMEFPLMSYAAGMFYRLFGNLESIYRILMILVVTVGLVMGFRTGMLFTGNFTWSAASALTMFLSPIMVFYTSNFLPDAASLGFILISWHYFFSFQQSNNKKHLRYACLWGGIAALIKITALISLISMCGLILISIARNYKSKHAKFSLRSQLKPIAILLIPIACTVSWYVYAKWLSQEYGSTMFLLGVKESLSLDRIKDDIKFIYDFWGNQYYTKTSSIVTIAVLATNLLLFKKANKTLLATTVLLLLGDLSFFALMSSQFRDHDYYLVTLLPFIMFNMLTFFSILNNFQVFDRKAVKPILALAISVFLIHNLTFCRHVYQYRYQPDSWMRSPEVLDKYFDTSEYLKSLNITKDDFVLSVYDWSTNVSLYLMDLKGIRIAPDEGILGVEKAIRNGADYIIINDPSVINDKLITPYLTNKVGEINGIYIYKLQNQ